LKGAPEVQERKDRAGPFRHRQTHRQRHRYRHANGVQCVYTGQATDILPERVGICALQTCLDPAQPEKGHRFSFFRNEILAAPIRSGIENMVQKRTVIAVCAKNLKRERPGNLEIAGPFD